MPAWELESIWTSFNVSTDLSFKFSDGMPKILNNKGDCYPRFRDGPKLGFLTSEWSLITHPVLSLVEADIFFIQDFLQTDLYYVFVIMLSLANDRRTCLLHSTINIR